MLKFVGVPVHCACKIGILNHSEEETFRYRTQDGVVDRQGFRTGREYESLEFDSRRVVASESSRIQGGSMSQPGDRGQVSRASPRFGRPKI